MLGTSTTPLSDRLPEVASSDMVEALRARRLTAACLEERRMAAPGRLADSVLAVYDPGRGDPGAVARDLVRSAYTLLLVDRGIDALRVAAVGRRASQATGDVVSELQAVLVSIDALVDVDRRQVDDLLLEGAVLAELSGQPGAKLKILRRELSLALRDGGDGREALDKAAVVQRSMGRSGWPVRWTALQLWSRLRDGSVQRAAFASDAAELVARGRGAPAEVMASVHLTLARASIDAGLPGLVLHHASAAELLAAREGHRRTARLARTVRSAQQVSLGSRSEMLVQVASRVARAPTLQDTLQAVVDASLQLLPVDRVFVLTKGAEGMEPVASASRRQPVGEPSWSVVSRVARTGEEVFTSDARTQDELADNSSLIRRGVHTVLAVPLMVDDVAVGVLYADAAITARQELTQVAWQLRTLAAQATQALHHDRLLRDSRQREHTAREVVHDVRNLLAALDGGVEWLRELIPSDADDDGVLADMGEGIRRSVAQLQRLLDGQTPVSERVDLRAVADDASMLLRHEARRRAVQVDVQGPYVEVDADRDELCRALFNLLGNALKYSPPHDVVVVRVIADGVWARVEVEDRGPGLPPGLDPFVSGVQGPDAAPGHGLGLGIVASVAARWGGDASVRPGETGGTVFELRLPIASSKEVPRSEKEPST